VTLNGTTIGAAASGATQRANSDTQSLFNYLWQNCPNAHCAVTGGRGVSAIADFNANKQITLPDMRAKTLAGRDCMGTTCAGILLPGNVTSGGGDGVDTPGAGGGQPNQTAKTSIATTNLPSNLSFAVTVTSISLSGGHHSHGPGSGSGFVDFGGGGFSLSSGGNAASIANNTADSGDIGGAFTGNGSGSTSCGGCNGAPATSTPFDDMSPFVLSTFYMKL
jgi:hypothetical protein